ncbi:hypothetical protein [Aquimarina sp. 2201CG14-23]|uniref:hypothetical protein n=1 Tax=Aquimarina mycalae TaxID=3040073 RepID=UPI002477D665|nr:hypothetical protein [Aquimarina sp. 2201CG14-23]MDH7446596.1 hypothetical protein [Aquimarina sp. 2201CG14-23]
MKINMFLFLILMISKFGFSQEDRSSLPKRDTQKNDLSINVHPFGIAEGITLNYDRVFNKKISLGINVFKSFDNENSIDNRDIDITSRTNFSVIPNIKYYVGERFARRFYIQGLAMISSGKLIAFVNNNPISQEINYTDVGLGVGIGDKRILKNGIFIDFGIAIAYNLFSKNSPDLLVHPNLSFGYRF